MTVSQPRTVLLAEVSPGQVECVTRTVVDPRVCISELESLLTTNSVQYYIYVH